jgi:8-oxo-dGTP diphosphatase
MIGCGIIFHNPAGKILLYLRDDLATIPEPGKWDLFGGRVEDGETPEQAIVRELKEELWLRSTGKGLQLKDFSLFRTYSFPDREEHVYWSLLNYSEDQLLLKEGQRLGWFAQPELEKLDIAFGFRQVLRDFLSSQLFKTT